MTVNAGDTINVWCQSQSPTAGYCTLFDVTTGVELTQQISDPTYIPGAGQLEGLSAEWVVEDYNDPPIPFANFHQVTFTNCEAIANNVTTLAWDPIYPNSGNTVVQVMNQGAGPLTSTTFPGTNEIQVTYV